MLNNALKNPGLIPYLTYGDPSPEIFEELASIAIEEGASVLEIGLPFSDPIADGPVIQASHQRALKHNPKMIDILECVNKLKSKYDTPIVLMGALNLVENFGVKSFFKLANESGVDGVLLPDLLFEENKPYKNIAKMYNEPIITLMSPLCDDRRQKEMIDDTDGFLYLMARLGITGESEFDNTHILKMVRKIKKIKDIPVAIGFGISHPDHVRSVCEVADAAIVGSYIVRALSNSKKPTTTLKKEMQFLQKGLN